MGDPVPLALGLLGALVIVAHFVGALALEHDERAADTAGDVCWCGRVHIVPDPDGGPGATVER